MLIALPFVQQQAVSIGRPVACQLHQHVFHLLVYPFWSGQTGDVGVDYFGRQLDYQFLHSPTHGSARIHRQIRPSTLVSVASLRPMVVTQLNRFRLGTIWIDLLFLLMALAAGFDCLGDRNLHYSWSLDYPPSSPVILAAPASFAHFAQTLFARNPFVQARCSCLAVPVAVVPLFHLLAFVDPEFA